MNPTKPISKLLTRPPVFIALIVGGIWGNLALMSNARNESYKQGLDDARTLIMSEKYSAVDAAVNGEVSGNFTREYAAAIRDSLIHP
jgi:hypothetical protein